MGPIVLPVTQDNGINIKQLDVIESRITTVQYQFWRRLSHFLKCKINDIKLKECQKVYNSYQLWEVLLSHLLKYKIKDVRLRCCFKSTYPLWDLLYPVAQDQRH